MFSMVFMKIRSSIRKRKAGNIIWDSKVNKEQANTRCFSPESHENYFNYSTYCYGFLIYNFGQLEKKPGIKLINRKSEVTAIF